MMKSGGTDHQLGETMALQIKRSKFSMVDPEHLTFQFEQIASSLFFLQMNFCKVLRKTPRHHNFTHVVNKAGDIIGFIRRRLDAAENFTRQDRSADAVLPEFPPRKSAFA